MRAWRDMTAASDVTACVTKPTPLVRQLAALEHEVVRPHVRGVVRVDDQLVRTVFRNPEVVAFATVRPEVLVAFRIEDIYYHLSHIAAGTLKHDDIALPCRPRINVPSGSLLDGSGYRLPIGNLLAPNGANKAYRDAIARNFVWIGIVGLECV